MKILGRGSVIKMMGMKILGRGSVINVELTSYWGLGIWHEPSGME